MSGGGGAHVPPPRAGGKAPLEAPDSQTVGSYLCVELPHLMALWLFCRLCRGIRHQSLRAWAPHCPLSPLIPSFVSVMPNRRSPSDPTVPLRRAPPPLLGSAPSCSILTRPLAHSTTKSRIRPHYDGISFPNYCCRIVCFSFQFYHLFWFLAF